MNVPPEMPKPRMHTSSYVLSGVALVVVLLAVFLYKQQTSTTPVGTSATASPQVTPTKKPSVTATPAGTASPAATATQPSVTPSATSKPAAGGSASSLDASLQSVDASMSKVDNSIQGADNPPADVNAAP